METSKTYSREYLVELLNREIPEKKKEKLREYFLYSNMIFKHDWFELFEQIPESKIESKAYVLQLCHSNNRLPHEIKEILGIL